MEAVCEKELLPSSVTTVNGSAESTGFSKRNRSHILFEYGFDVYGLFICHFNSETYSEGHFDINIYDMLIFSKESSSSPTCTSVMNSCLSLAEMKPEIKIVL